MLYLWGMFLKILQRFKYEYCKELSFTCCKLSKNKLNVILVRYKKGNTIELFEYKLIQYSKLNTVSQ